MSEEPTPEQKAKSRRIRFEFYYMPWIKYLLAVSTVLFVGNELITAIENSADWLRKHNMLSELTWQQVTVAVAAILALSIVLAVIFVGIFRILKDE